MNVRWNEINEHWRQFEHMLKCRWQELTKIDLEQINGNKAMLSVKLQGHYKQNKEEADKSIDDFLGTFRGILQGKHAFPLIKIGKQIHVKPANKPVLDPVESTGGYII